MSYLIIICKLIGEGILLKLIKTLKDSDGNTYFVNSDSRVLVLSSPKHFKTPTKGVRVIEFAPTFLNKQNEVKISETKI